MNRNTLLAGVAVALVFPAAVRAATIAVPFEVPTIQGAIDVAQDHDEILVSPGEYVGTLNMLGKKITLRSTNGAPLTTLNGIGLGSVITCDTGEELDTVIDGFTITGGTGTTLGVRTGGGGMLNFSSSPTIQNCVFSGNAADDGGAIFNFVGNPRIINCLIADNSASGFLGAGGAVYNEFSNPVMTNCTMTDNFATDGGGIYAEQGSPRLINSIVYGNTPNPFDGPNAVIASFSNVPIPSFPGEGNITDPLFVDVPGGDIRLSSGSPCIDRGDSTAIATEFFEDLNGEDRGVDDTGTLNRGVAVFGLTVDMGAYEYQGTACPADVDGSGDVGFSDIIDIVIYWGPCP